MKRTLRKRCEAGRKIYQRLGGATGAFRPYILHRKSVPQWLTDAYAQSMRDAPNGTLPLLVLHPAGWSIDESLVIVGLKDFTEWYA